MEACNQFRREANHAVAIAPFYRILKFDTRSNAELAYNDLKNKSGRVDWLAVIAVMILTSNQKYISKVTFLFSLCDFNGDGRVNAAELNIGMRYLCSGVQRCFENSKLPSPSEMERSTTAAFKKIDTDNTKFISIEEIVTFAYNSKSLRLLLSPFSAAADARIFENAVIFSDTHDSQKKRQSVLLDSQEKKMIADLTLTPGSATERHTTLRERRRAHKRKNRVTPWKENAFLTQPVAWMIYSFFFELRDTETNTLPIEAVLDIAKNHVALESLFEKAMRNAGEQIDLVREAEEHSASPMGKKGSPGGPIPAELLQTRFQVQRRVQDPAFLSRIDDMGEDDLSLRGLLCALASDASEAEIEDGMRWCSKFRANHILTELLKHDKSDMVDPQYFAKREATAAPELDLHADDLEILFGLLDSDGDGQIDVKNLVEMGGLSSDDAHKLVQLWDRGRDGALSRSDVLAIIHQMHAVVRQSMKAMFAQTRSLHSPDFRPDSQLSVRSPSPFGDNRTDSRYSVRSPSPFGVQRDAR